jgi:hypothetical protein
LVAFLDALAFLKDTVIERRFSPEKPLSEPVTSTQYTSGLTQELIPIEWRIGTGFIVGVWQKTDEYPENKSHYRKVVKEGRVTTASPVTRPQLKIIPPE